MKLFLIVFLFGISFIANGQDTLVLKNATKLVVHVKEVSQAEIHYKKMEAPGDVMYVMNTGEVEKIIYKNGYVEVLASTQPPQDKQFVVISGMPAVNNGKITLDQAKRNHYALKKLISMHPDSTRKEPLTKISLRIESLKKKERGATFSAIVVGGIAAGGFALYSGGMNVMSIDVDDLLIPPLVMSGVAATLGATAIVVHIGVRKKQKKFVRLYNE